MFLFATIAKLVTRFFIMRDVCLNPQVVLKYEPVFLLYFLISFHLNEQNVIFMLCVISLVFFMMPIKCLTPKCGSSLNICFKFLFKCVYIVINFVKLVLLAEYMPGGSLYEYLHKNHNLLKHLQLVKFAVDVCKGMEYLHQNNIIHRDLKTANLLMDTHNVSILRKGLF